MPCFLYANGVRHRSLRLIRFASGYTLFGVILSRANVSLIAFNWRETSRYYPSWMELVITLTIVFAEIWLFRWVVNRMPVLHDPHAHG